MSEFHQCGNNCCGAEKPKGHQGRALTFHECVGKYMCLYTLVRGQAVSVWGGAGVAQHEGSFPSTVRAMELSRGLTGEIRGQCGSVRAAAGDLHLHLFHYTHVPAMWPVIASDLPAQFMPPSPSE